MVNSVSRIKARPTTGNYPTLGYVADGAITAGAVVTDGTNAEDVSEAAAGDNFVGVAKPNTLYDETADSDDHDDGDSVEVVVGGILLLEANASVAKGDTLVTDAAGTVKPAAADGTDDNNTVVGKALENGSDGDRIEVRI